MTEACPTGARGWRACATSRFPTRIFSRYVSSVGEPAVLGADLRCSSALQPVETRIARAVKAFLDLGRLAVGHTRLVQATASPSGPLSSRSLDSRSLTGRERPKRAPGICLVQSDSSVQRRPSTPTTTSTCRDFGDLVISRVLRDRSRTDLRRAPLIFGTKELGTDHGAAPPRPSRPTPSQNRERLRHSRSFTFPDRVSMLGSAYLIARTLSPVAATSTNEP